ncbi:hypothetical protein, partial [uncultured Muribaculum sp.]|uniref:hypothetical protein n=1 Tax=uncultured Muribaculum sp. TaxID=1918613 RepID=UPI0025AF0CCF
NSINFTLLAACADLFPELSRNVTLQLPYPRSMQVPLMPLNHIMKRHPHGASRPSLPTRPVVTSP